MKLLLQNAAANAVGSIFDRGGMVALTAILSGALSAEAFRQFGQFQLTLSMLAALSSVGVAVSVSRLFAEHRGGTSEELHLAGTMWALSLIAALAFGGLATALGLISGGAVVHTVAIAAGVFVVTAGIVAGGGVLGLALFRHAAAVSVVAACVLMGVGAVAAASRSLPLALASVVAAYTVSTVLMTAIVLRKVPAHAIFTRKVLSADSIARAASMIGPLALVTLLASSSNWLLGQILHFSPNPTLDFAGFIIGLQWFAIVQFVPGMISRAIFPEMVRWGLNGGQGAGQKELGLSLLLSVGVAVAVFLVILIGSPIFAKAYDAGSVGNGIVLVAYSAAALPQCLANLFGNLLVASKNGAVWAGLTVEWFVFLLVAGGLLHRLGAIGVAIALAIAGLLLAVRAFSHLQRRGLIRI